MADFDFDTPIDRTGTLSNKWDRAGERFHTRTPLLPFSVADTDFACPPCVMDALRHRLEHPIFGYSSAGPEFYQAACGWMERRHQIRLEPAWLWATTGIITGLAFALRTVTSPGDRVLTFTPVYNPFFYIVESAGLELVECPMTHTAGHYALDLNAAERAFRSGIRAVLFCNPHNPTGRVWSREELQELVNLCVQYGVYLISDEAHADYALFGNRYTPIAAFPELHERAVSCIAANKTFNIPGLSAAILVIPDAALKERVEEALRGVWINTPNILGIVASTAGFSQGDDWLDSQLAYLENNSRFLRTFAAEHLPHIQIADHEGTYLMWMDCSCFGMPMGELSSLLADQYGVGLPDGSIYRGDGDRHLRINIGCARSLLQQGLEDIVPLYQKRC